MQVWQEGVKRWEGGRKGMERKREKRRELGERVQKISNKEEST